MGPSGRERKGRVADLQQAARADRKSPRSRELAGGQPRRVAVARASNFNDAAALVSVDFCSPRLGTYTLLVDHPKDYNGNDPGEIDRTGVLSAFTLEVLAPFLDGFESGNACAWSNAGSFAECAD